MFTLRFDLRAPATGAPTTDLYRAAIEMAAWSESHGGLATMLCEHHAASDGYLPAPVPMAAAIASRTTTMPIVIAVVLLPLYDPVRLAEEMAVLDIISNGRVSYVGGVGYRPEEYEMYGVDMHRRGAIAESHLAFLLQAIKGEPFEYEGRRVHVTPPPVTPGGPTISWGGGTVAAARRAGRYGLDFFAQKDGDDLRVAYEEESRKHGHEPGNCILPARDAPSTIFVADDVDRAWEELGPYLMHDVLSYAEWNQNTKDTSSLSFVSTAEELRAENASHRIFSVDEAIEFARAGGLLGLHPIIGGLPPEIAWRYLEIVADKVMPALAG
jgi:alkanesulfonate monooxygenase SsuD/methylene tetrahydromethanopterin reductase-like flavin-dependent oxidoreductase (luciferase family)